MKKLIAVIIFISCLCLSGCSEDLNRQDISTVDIIHCMGFDFEEGIYKITAVYNSTPGAEEETFTAVTGEGSSIMTAFADMQRKNEKLITIAHANYYIFGEQAAAVHFDDFLDYLSYNADIRLDALVFCIREKMAYEVLEKTEKLSAFTSPDLDSIRQKLQKNYKKVYSTIGELEARQAEQMPMMLIGVTIENDEPIIEGGAILESGKGVAFTDDRITMGLALAENNLCAIEFQYEDILIEMYEAKTKLDGGAVISGSARAMGMEQSKERLHNAQTALNSFLCDMVNAAIEWSQEKGLHYTKLTENTEIIARVKCEWITLT